MQPPEPRSRRLKPALGASADALDRLRAAGRGETEPPRAAPPLDVLNLPATQPLAAKHRWGPPTPLRGLAPAVLFLASVIGLCLALWTFWATPGQSQTLIAGGSTSAGTGASLAHPAAVATGSVVNPTAPSLPAVTQIPISVAAEGIVVDVVGKVRRPGLVTLSAGARVADAVTAAGGPAPDAVLARINLARRVSDGEQIVVPDRDDQVAAVPDPNAPTGLGQSGGQRVNLNTASVSELDALPGVGPVTAQRIIDFRSQHPFTSVEELLEISGIGPSLLTKVRPLVSV